jgi:primosomal protein N' (replication factor Y)
MFYYETALLGAHLSPLTYNSSSQIELGTIVEVPLKKSIKRAVVVKEVEKPEFPTEPIGKVTEEFYTPKQLEIAKFIKEYYFSGFGEALALFLPYTSKEFSFESQMYEELPTLTPLQEKALAQIEQKELSLLFGVTGSGKTEIYIHLIAKALKEGKSAVVLMPEIALTPQITKRIEGYFGKIVATWHSKITKKRKEQIVEGIRNAEVRVVIGARSALFLPLFNLGLIVVDEAHDDSYKAMSRPRYNAKDLSIYIGKKLNAKVVLGSATPLANDYYKFDVVPLKKPYKVAKKEYRFIAGEEINFEILGAIKRVLENGEQALVFVPTRANFKYLICMECGSAQMCPFCSIGMSLHRKKRALVCHYCNYTQKIPQKCHHCGSEALSTKRIGTAEVKELIEEEIGEARVELFDKDSISTISKLSKALKRVSSGESNVVIGTQMLSKGHDYPEITLSVITGLDYTLAMGDYRAKERSIALMHQIAGRSGRSKDATILIQSGQPDFFKAYLNDYEDFLKEELEFREGLYPPFTNLARVLVAKRDYKQGKELLESVVQRLQLFKDIEIVGSGEAPIERIANRWRFVVLLRSSRKKALLEALHSVAENRDLEIDIDPVNFS